MDGVNKIEYYFLKISAERFAADLREFSKEINNFSDEQLIAIISRSDCIEQCIESMRKELSRRVGNGF